jgi:hypothetical protein
MDCSRSFICNHTDRPTKPTKSLVTEFSARFQYAQSGQSVFLQNLTCPYKKWDFLRHWQWGEPSPTIWRHSVWSVCTDVSEQPTVSFIKLDEPLTIHQTWWWKSRFLRNVDVSTTIPNVVIQKLLIFLILSSFSDCQLNLRTLWSAHPASSLTLSAIRWLW